MPVGWLIVAGLAGAVALFFLVTRVTAKTVPRAFDPHLVPLPRLTPLSFTGGFGGGIPVDKVPLEEAVNRLSTAIAKFETGVRAPGPFPLDPSQWQGRAKRNLNPGNLRFGIQRDARGVDADQYSIFATVEDGWLALKADVRAKLTGRTITRLGPTSTLADFIGVYAPEVENPTASYIAFVSKEIGIAPETRFRDWIEV